MSDTHLTLKLIDNAASASGSRDVVARVQTLDPADGGIVQQDVVIPTGAAAGIDVPVQPGAYNVQVILPTGRMLQRNCYAAAGETVPLTFQEPSNFRPRFSLQDAIGSSSVDELLELAIGSRRGDLRALVDIVRAEAPQVLAGQPSGLFGRLGLYLLGKIGAAVGITQFAAPAVMGTQAASAGPAHPAPPPPPVEPRQAQLWLGPLPQLAGQAGWAALAGPPRGTPAPEGIMPAPEGAVGEVKLWRLPGNIAGDQGGGVRCWGIVETAGCTELVSVPAPWRCTRSLDLSAIDILVDPSIRGRAAASVAVHDDGLDGLLSYLDRGRLSSARPIVETLDTAGTVTDAIHGKHQNPLAACAAAYVGLAIFDPAEQERWDGWLPGLMELFPWLPDAAVVHARRIVLRPNGIDETPQALAALERAFNAGIPYYSTGVQLMREMLTLFSAEERAREMLDAVAPVASRVDPRQMFTVLRYPLR